MNLVNNENKTSDQLTRIIKSTKYNHQINQI